jgi:glycosyltransferase involved in cell wall biosynthesis
MNVLYLHQFFVTPEEPGSSRSYAMVRHLVESGHRVTLIAGAKNYYSDRPSGRSGGRWITREERDGLTILRVGIFFPYQKTLWIRFITFLNFMVLAFVAGLRTGAADVVFATSPPLTVGLPGWLLSVWKRAAFVFEVRDLWPETAVTIGLLRNRLVIHLATAFEELFYRRAARIICLTRGILERLRSRGVPEEKLALVSHGADVEFIQPGDRRNSFRRELGLEDQFIAVYAGAFGMANGLELVLEAADLLRTEPDVVFVLVGNGNAEAGLRAEAKRRALPNVVFTGLRPKSEIPGVLAAGDAGLMILRPNLLVGTACPNKFFDYLAAGRPVLINFSGEARELVERAGAGLYIRDSRADALADAVRYLRDNPAEREAMGCRARRLAVEEYARPRQTARFEQVLREARG